MFLSGITYYTYSLVNALEAASDASALLMRRLLPRRLYPGRARVGAQLSELELNPGIPCSTASTGTGAPRWREPIRFLRRERPDVVVFQWWTGACCTTTWRSRRAARMLGTRVSSSSTRPRTSARATRARPRAT